MLIDLLRQGTLICAVIWLILALLPPYSCLNYSFVSIAVLCLGIALFSTPRRQRLLAPDGTRKLAPLTKPIFLRRVETQSGAHDDVWVTSADASLIEDAIKIGRPGLVMVTGYTAEWRGPLAMEIHGKSSKYSDSVYGVKAERMPVFINPKFVVYIGAEESVQEFIDANKDITDA